jgi:hypothetical protein
MSPPDGVVADTIHHGFITSRMTSEIPVRVKMIGHGELRAVSRGVVTSGAV